MLVFGLVAERSKMPYKPSSESGAVLDTKTPWRAASGAARAIPACRLDPDSVVWSQLSGISGWFMGLESWMASEGRFLRKPRPAPSGGERLFRKNYSLLREYLIPFREDSQPHGKFWVAENKWL